MQTKNDMVNPLEATAPLKSVVSRFAKKATDFAGSWVATLLSFALVIMWIAGGIFKFGFGSGYQNLIGTVTNVMTFVMVFFIQHTQNRESKALQIKLDELILKIQKADNSLISIEELSEEELMAMQAKYKKLAAEARARAEKAGEVDE